MTVNRMYHPPSDIDSLYMPRMEGGQRLLGMAECVETEEQNLSLYLVQLEEKLLSFSKSKRILRNKQKKEERHKQWKEKQLHGKFVRETEEVRIEETREWIRKGYLKKETEGLIFITQEQALRARWIRKNIDDQEVSEKCRMYGKRDESITHLIAQCKKLTQKEYKGIIILQEFYTFLKLASLSGIITNLQVQLRMTGSKYCGKLTSKQTMSFSTEDLTQLHCTKLKRSVAVLILLCLETKGLS